MELLKANYINTTSMLVVQSNTDTASYIFDRDPRFQWVSSGYTGVTTATLRINFTETATVTRIAVMGHNLKDYVIYYNGVTANTFAMSTGVATTASDFATNSETSQYFRVNSVDCTSLSIDMRGTMVAGVERAIGFVMVSTAEIILPRPPSAKNYKIQLDPKDVVHTLSDGGTRIQNIADKYFATLKYDYLSATLRDTLKDIWGLHKEMVFCPFGTTTAWDKVLFPCVWEGNFDFHEYSDNAAGAGFSGQIKLKETPR